MSAWRNLKRQAKYHANSGKPTIPTGNTADNPKLSPSHAQAATPSDCPKNKHEANKETAEPRADGAICVACV